MAQALHKRAQAIKYYNKSKQDYCWNIRKASESERFEDMFNNSIGLVRKWSEIRVGLVAA